MPKAVWNGAVLAESGETIVVEGNHYFPPDSVRWEHFQESAKTSSCPWKGRAGYHDVVVDGKVNRNAAWHYQRPSAAAANIADYVAFWRGVRVERSGTEATPEGGGGFFRRLLGGRAA